MQFEKVKSFFTDIETSKWTVAVGGGVNDQQTKKPSAGYFIEPTIIDRPPENSRIVVEEPFGPILPLLTWSSEEEVVQRANNTKMGLGASVWSDDLNQATRIARQLEAGSVWINTHQEGNPLAPFGGHKESGLGYEWGRGGLASYCNVQSLFLKSS
jgi:acyl-CoA reductase-like NAD-dependent aldehyde dehydrogenase